MKPEKMTNAEYHAAEGVSKSDLDLIHLSPAHFKARKGNQLQTPAMLIGSAIHKLVLEPDDFGNEYTAVPECDRRTKEGKAIYAEFMEKSAGKSLLTAQQLADVSAVSDAVLNHSLAGKLLAGGQAETSYFWHDEKNSLLCKCRPDYLKGRYCIDLKTTQSARPEDFMKSAYNFRYHVQAYWYLKGLKACGVNAEKFIFIAVEKEPPYAVCVYVAGEDFLRLGEKEAEKDLETYRRCLETGCWHGYDEEPAIHTLELPAWVRKEAYYE